MKGSQSYSFWVDLTTIVCLSNPSLSEREKTLLRPVAFPFLLKEWSKTKCLSQSALIVNTQCSLCWYFNLFFSSVLRILCFFQLQNIENCDNSFLYKAQYSCGSGYCLCVYICPVIVYNLCICLKAVFQHLYLKERLTTKQKRIAEHLTFTCSIQYSLCMQIWPAKVLLQKVNEVLNCLILKAVFFLLQLKLNEANSEFVTSKGLQFSFSYLNFFFFFWKLFRTSTALHRECSRTGSSLEFTTRAWHCISDNKEIFNSRHDETLQWYVFFLIGYHCVPTGNCNSFIVISLKQNFPEHLNYQYIIKACASLRVVLSSF